MNNLIPEKRVDRNGKMVTKHVRNNSQQATRRSTVPAPSLGAKQGNKDAQKPYKPKAKQLEYKYIYELVPLTVDYPLMDDKERERVNHSRYLSTYNFRINDVELYDVFSAASFENAMHLMSKGVRSAEEAREYLHAHNAAHLIEDHSETMQRALERGMDAYTFIDNYRYLSDEDKQSDYALDAVQFRATPLHKGMNSFMVEKILDGSISYSDVKAIGITKLKSYDRLHSLGETLKKLHSGEADYTIDDVKSFVDRAAEEKLDTDGFRYAARLFASKGPGFISKVTKLSAIYSEALTYARDSNKYGTDSESINDRIEYAVLLREGTSGGRYIGFSDQFYEAGIPVETASKVVAAGGGIREAKAIHEGGIEDSLAGGWL